MEFIERTFGKDAIDCMESTVHLFALALQYRLREIGAGTPERGRRQRLAAHQEIFVDFVTSLFVSPGPERDLSLSDLEILQQAVAATAARMAVRQKKNDIVAQRDGHRTVHTKTERLPPGSRSPTAVPAAPQSIIPPSTPGLQAGTLRIRWSVEKRYQPEPRFRTVLANLAYLHKFLQSQ